MMKNRESMICLWRMSKNIVKLNPNLEINKTIIMKSVLFTDKKPRMKMLCIVLLVGLKMDE